MFQFELFPVDEIPGWGTPPALGLHWFGLTYGAYFIQAGETELLRYSDAWLAQNQPSAAAWYAGAYVDYQVARLHEDLLDLLPFATCPVPTEIADLLRRARPARVRERLRARSQSGALSASQVAAVEEAAEWLRLIKLDMSYLTRSPELRLWESAGEVTLEWDAPDETSDGVPVWSSAHARVCMPKGDFVAAVAAFDRELMSQMEARIAAARRGWSRPEIAIDLDALEREHAERASWLRNADRRCIIPPSWSRIGEGLAFGVEP